MEKLKQYKYIILLALVILGFAFYWYEWRPSKIRERCFIEAEFNGLVMTSIHEPEIYYKNLNNYYQNCLKRFGLEK